MRKERTKTVVLILLILNCLQLTGQIWFNKKLWPSGYNFFNWAANVPGLSAVIRYVPFYTPPQTEETLYSAPIRPRRLVVSSEKARVVAYPGQPLYEESRQAVGGVLSALAEQSPAPVTISAERWQGYLKADSIYVDFGFSMDLATLVRLYAPSPGTASPAGGAVSAVMITADSVTNDAIVCMYDAQARVAAEYLVDYRGSELLSYIQKVTYGKSRDISFVFEQNWDGGSSASVERPILLDGYMLFPTGLLGEQMETVRVANPLSPAAPEGEGIDFDRIVREIGYTPSALRKNISQDGVVNYTENNATIRISPNGVVEYNAVEAQKGLLLQSGRAEPYKLAGSVTRIAHAVWNGASSRPAPELQLVSSILESKDGIYTIRLNYAFNGVAVVTQSEGEQIENAVYAQIKDGYLKSFKMVLRELEGSGEARTALPFIGALDQLALVLGRPEGQTRVADMFPCYQTENLLGGETGAAWGVKTTEAETIVVVGDTDFKSAQGNRAAPNT